MALQGHVIDVVVFYPRRGFNLDQIPGTGSIDLFKNVNTRIGTAFGAGRGLKD